MATGSASPKTRPSESRPSGRRSTSSFRTPPRRPPERFRPTRGKAAGAGRKTLTGAHRAGVLALVVGGGSLAVLRATRISRRQRPQHRGLARAVPALRPLERRAADEDPRAGGEPALVRRGGAGARRRGPGASGGPAGFRAPGRAPRRVGQRAGRGGRGGDRRVFPRM